MTPANIMSTDQSTMQAPAPTGIDPSGGPSKPMRADYEQVARVYAEAYGKHEGAPAYLPRTAQAVADFKPDAWVVAAMMQSYHDGRADGETKEGIRQARALDIDAAAKKLAESFDYPWENMPKQGRQNMRKIVQAVLAAAKVAGAST